jgi:dienelactone hydrolase
VPQTVEFPSGTLHLKGYLWKPVGPGPFPAVLFSHGSGGNEADVTAGMQMTCEKANRRRRLVLTPLVTSTNALKGHKVLFRASHPPVK